ncbi:hypothetical protein IC757_06445 [Wenzhouxiangella sp. AB-CW3]|uniref:hypothetical protein n=1 Tax=Wenzhouxiangella sp. AB-CW3 TaxID=2771012 RepID=UPI00168BF9A7|nr:hypothetical protein [Wenzhouxiangella sp. AB-CW3]QOC23761.1 hypothetical protein IC757_06445 [Wenzhouxiangella sp. AB-CW3]
MTERSNDMERLRFLARVIEGETRNLEATNARLFSEPFTAEAAERLDEDQALSERVDAFVARFSRLQDTLGDKLLPALLKALGEERALLIDRLDTAEKLGWIESSEQWMVIRQLRNQMIHEYIEDSTVLAEALQAGHDYVEELTNAARNMLGELEKRGWK